MSKEALGSRKNSPYKLVKQAMKAAILLCKRAQMTVDGHQSGFKMCSLMRICPDYIQWAFRGGFHLLNQLCQPTSLIAAVCLHARCTVFSKEMDEYAESFGWA